MVYGMAQLFAWPQAGYAQPVALLESAPMLRGQTVTNNEYLLRGHSASTSFSTTAHVTYKWYQPFLPRLLDALFRL